MPNDDVKLSFLQWLASEDQTRQDNYRAYREYYDGDHDTVLTTKQRQYLQAKTGQEFNANFCPIVVDTLVEKLQVRGFNAKGQEDIFWKWWEFNGMDGEQGQTHLAAVRDGDAYVMAEWDNEANMPRWSFEMACCDGEGAKVHYSADRRGQYDFASKRWRVNQGPEAGYVRRLNLYYPDRIEKYVSNSEAGEGEWRKYTDETDARWPIPWLHADGTPLGVNWSHFCNKKQGYNYGTSELKDVIPQQVALNKAVIDLLAAGATTAFRIFVALGFNPTGIEITPGSWIYNPQPATGPDAGSISHIPGEDLSPLIDLKNSFAIEIARISRTPLSAFQVTGAVASENTLKQQESGLVSKANNRAVYFGNSWERLMRISRRLANTFGTGYNMDESVTISTLWAPTQTRDETEELDRAAKKQNLGIPQETIWAEIGYSKEQIDEMKAIKEAERKAEMAAMPDHLNAISAAATRIVSRGA